HVHADSSELGRVYRPTIAINADPASFAASLQTIGNTVPANRAARVARMHQSYLAWSTPPETGPGAVQMGLIVNWLEKNLPEDAIMTNGAGNYATWIHRFHRFRGFTTQAAPTSGTMGYGVPGAVGAQQA